ncbi:hypothetical protein TWF481_004413 [Arthrobotrys musiformis]|uniref:Peptidase S53 domain-containing protein n=1 Tax=Arthrobotrys musiformis TaxID=47236 RepID=A0AAV9WJH7_9PEZI
MRSLLVLLRGISILATASPIDPIHAIHEKREVENHAWFKRSPAEHSSVLPMRIGLKQRNLDKGHDLLMEISTPGSPKYGNHFSKLEVVEMFAPSAESERMVIEWLEDSGFHPDRISISANRQWVQFDAPVSEVERLLRTSYHIYEHKRSGRLNVACDMYHIPRRIQEHIDYITPGIKLFPPSGPLSPEREELRKRELQSKRDEASAAAPNQKIKRQGPLPPGYGLNPITSILDAVFSTLVQGISGVFPCSYVNTVAVTPKCVRELYNITELPANTQVNPNNKLGIFQGLGQLYSKSDVSTFNTLFTRIPSGKGNPELRSIDGGRGSTSYPTDPVGDESNLDIQASHHIIYPQGEALFSTDDMPTQTNYNYSGFLNNYLDGIDGSYCSFSAFGITGNSNDTDPPLDPPYPNPKNAGKPGAYAGPLDCGTQSPTYVTSISYGGPENTLGLPANYQLRQRAEFMKLALQGYTHVVASGDSGVAAGGEDDDNPNACLRPAGQTSGPGTIFNPDFPSNCPYILSVGSTEYASGGKERATKSFGSGGGFSNVHVQPSYQSAAVANYFATTTLPFGSYDLTDPNQSIGSGGGLYNKGGRGYPDVAALGYNLIIITRGVPALVGGTSASAPIWAAMLTRVNEERLRRNLTTVGFVQPALYQNAALFNDITVGSNPGGCSKTGFPTATGWDSVTGLGSITLPKLFTIFGVA